MKKYVSSLVIVLFLSLPLFALVRVEPVSSLDEHDVGIANVTIDCSVVWYFAPSRINVTVTNYGSNDETVNVTVYMNSTAVKEVDGIILTSGNSSFVFSFLWDGRDLLTTWYGSYILSAYAHPVLGETNISNNNFVEGIVKLTKRGDVNGDGAVNVLDLAMIASHLGKIPPFGYYQPPIFEPIPFRIDSNNDGKINVLDLIVVANSLHI